MAILSSLILQILGSTIAVSVLAILFDWLIPNHQIISFGSLWLL